MQRHWLIGTRLPFLLLCGVASAVHAESASLGPIAASSGLQHPALLASNSSQFTPFQPRISVNGALGSDRSLAVTEGWAPLWQDDFNVFYGDIRAMVDDGNNEEYNLGFGYRALRGSQIGGLHAWLDKRDTQLGSTFYQATLGAELLTHDVDLRFNMYLPITGTKHHITPVVGSGAPYLAGTGIFYNTNGQLTEEPQKGLDLEAGYRLPILQAYVDAFRVYGGGYAFLGDETDDVVGLRARTQIDVNPWLSIGARLQRDDERGTQGFLEATLRFPVSAKKMIQHEGVRARMDESPERDVDIVTGSKVVDTGVGRPVINTETGQAQRVLYVDNTTAAGGAGTKENPFNNLKTAEANLQAKDILYVFRGDGTTAGQDKGIVISKDNVSLIGSGVNFTYDGGTFAAGGSGRDFSGALLLAAGAAPVFTNTNNAVDAYAGNGVLVQADNAVVTGIEVANATGYGIAARFENGQTYNAITIRNNITHDNANYGMHVLAGAGSTIKNVVISDNRSTQDLRGVVAQIGTSSPGTMEHVTISNNVINSVRQVGINVNFGSGLLDTLLLDKNEVNNSGTYGIYALANNSATINKVTMSNNTATGNANTAIFAQANNSTSALIKDVEILNNTATDNLSDGIGLTATIGGKIEKLRIEGNTATNNQSNGILVSTSASSATIGDAQVIGNSTNGNASAGIRVQAASTGIINAALIKDNIARENLYGVLVNNSNAAYVNSATVVGNLLENNLQHGLHLNATGGAAGNLVASVFDNTITGNGTASTSDPNLYYGVYVRNNGTAPYTVDLGGGTLGSTGGNRIYGNAYRDIYIDSRPGTAAATFGTIIAAQHNWWGVGTGLNQATRATFDNGTAGVNGSRINATNYLTVDPGL